MAAMVPGQDLAGALVRHWKKQDAGGKSLSIAWGAAGKAVPGEDKTDQGGDGMKLT